MKVYVKCLLLFPLYCLSTCTSNRHLKLSWFKIVGISYFFPGGTVVKIPPANSGDTRDVGLIPGLGRSPGEGKDSVLQYSSLSSCMRAHTHTHTHTYVHAKSLQSYLTLCDAMNCSLPGFSVPGASQSTGVGYHALLQRNFLTQGSNTHSSPSW